MTSLGGRGRLWVGFVVASAWIIASCGRDPQIEPEDHQVGRSLGVMAQVNKAKLEEDELRRLIPSDVHDAITGPEITDILDRWVNTELLYQASRNQGLDREPEVAKLLHEMERQIMAEEYLQRELRNRVNVTTEEIRDHYDANKHHYTRECHLRHIVVDTPDEAEEIMNQLRKGASFEQLAKERSIDPTASRGGDLGYLSKGAMNPAFEPFVFDMKKDEIRGPIVSNFGFHIVKLVRQRKASKPVTFEFAREEILQNLLHKKQQEAHEQLLSELRQKAKVSRASSYAGMPLVPEDTTSEPPQRISPRDSSETQGTH